MRTSRHIPTTSGFGLALRRAGSVLRESVLLAAAISLVELAGPFAPHDGADLVVMVGAVLLGLLLAQAARAGWMPATRRVGLGLWQRLRRLGRQLSPRYAVAFRASPETHALPDRTLRGPTLWLLVLLAAVTAGGPWLFDGLALLERHVGYTPYLAALAVVWAVLFFSVIFGCIAAAQWLHAVARRRGGAALPFVAFGAAWVGGLVALSVLPGWTVLAAVLLAGWWTGRSLGGVPQQGYLFCRRDGSGRARTIPVQAYLRQVHTVIVLALAVVVVLGQAPRLWFAAWPASPFAFTSWLGLLASLCALLLIARAGAHFRRVVGGGQVPPEVPLTPTLWIRRRGALLEGSDEARSEAYWHDVAREGGWLVLRAPEEPAHEFDLVLGDESDPRRFVPREPADEDDARFQLTRRFHVVLRRRFHRSFEGLYKLLRAETPAEGTGFLFCPHVWLVPGVVRDMETRRRSGSSGSLVGPAFYGPPYAQVFPARVRRYVGAILRDLQVDIIYWEDAVTWRDIRRVLTVAYEVHDQRRGPVRERHFQGLPRVRVVLQEEAAEPEPPQALPTRPEGSLPEAAPGHARILLILKDRGRREDVETPDPADHGIRSPSLVG